MNSFGEQKKLSKYKQQAAMFEVTNMRFIKKNLSDSKQYCGQLLSKTLSGLTPDDNHKRAKILHIQFV